MKIEEKKLKSGLRIITVPMKDSLTTTVLIMVGTGSKYETKEQSGLSHFLEHMCFKGTIKRPKSIDISHEFDSIGAQNNAFTSFEYTGYYGKAHPKHTEKMIEVLADLYLNPTFPDTELQKEKGVIIEEMNMYEDLPQRYVRDVFSDLLYGDQPAGWSIIGNKNIIKKATREDFICYRKEHYVAEATTIVVAGHINSKKIISLVEKSFSSISQGKKKGKVKIKEVQKSPQIKIKFKKTDQAHLMLGVRTFSIFHPKIPILEVLCAILGQGMSSRLFQRLREEMGVGYYVRASADSFTDHGYLSVNTGVDTKRVPEVVGAILDEFKKLKSVLVSDIELSKAKESLLGSFVMDLESSDSVAEYVGDRAVLKNVIESPKDVELKIRKVTAREVQKLAQQIFKNDGLNLAIIGNLNGADSLRSILKI